jgi:hypothetical protein
MRGDDRHVSRHASISPSRMRACAVVDDDGEVGMPLEHTRERGKCRGSTSASNTSRWAIIASNAGASRESASHRRQARPAPWAAARREAAARRAVQSGRGIEAANGATRRRP